MKQVLGQPAAINTLQQALAAGRVHHAWIFHGPAGVGKFTTARAFARVLLCREPTTTDAGLIEACGQCASCHLVDAPDAAHPDLHVVTKELARFSADRNVRERKLTNIPREVLVNALVEPAYRRASLGGPKVFIVDEAELIAPIGQNTLLKTLEEPPAGTHIMLVTAHEDRLLPTIRSRCQRVAFGPLGDAAVRHWLDENTPVSGERTRWLVRFARGSIGRAALAVEYQQDQWLRTVEPMVDQVAAGKPVDDLGDAMAGLCDEFARAWVDANKNASKDAANKQAVRTMLGMLAQICRERLATAADPQAAAPWLAGIDLVASAERHLNANVAVALLLNNLAVQWIHSVRQASRGVQPLPALAPW